MIPEAKIDEDRQQPRDEIPSPPARQRSEDIFLLVLICAAATSIFIYILHALFPDLLVNVIERFAHDRQLAPATRSFLKQFIETAALLTAFLSVFGLLTNYLPREKRPLIFGSMIALAGVLHWLYYYPFTIDDAYISLVYARNLASGNGLVFNVGERVEGYTNLLWVLLEALVFKLHLSPIAAIKVLGLLCELGVLALTYRISRLVMGQTDFAFLAPVLLVISPPFATASALGLETQLFTLLIMAAVFLYLKNEDPSPGYLVPLLLALATLTRPEGALFFGLIYAHAFVSQLARKRLSGRLFLGGLLFAAIVGAHLAWRYFYYGSLLPNTYYAKLEGSHWRAAWGYGYVKQFFAAFGGSLFVICLIPFVRREKLSQKLLLLLLIVPYLLYVMYAGGDWIPRFRFIEPVMPFILILFAAGAGELLSAFERTTPRTMTAKIVLLIVFGFVVHFYFADTVAQHHFAMVRAGGAKESHIGLGRWLREHTGPDDSIALMDVGMIKYYSGREVIDITGLTDAHVAHFPGGFLKKRFDIAYLLEREPKYVVLVSHNDISSGAPFSSSYVIDKSIHDNPRFQEKYRFVYNIDHMRLRDNPGPDNGYWMNVFQRKDDVLSQVE